MSDSILQVNQIKDKGGNATGITIADSTANVSIGTNLAVNTINEVTSANGVTIDGLKVKDYSLMYGSNVGLTIDSSGRTTQPNQPAFSVKKSTTQTNLAHNTYVDISFDSEIFDQGSNFGSNVFTAPVTGRYQLNANIQLLAVDAGATFYQLQIVTSNRGYPLNMSPKFSSGVDYWMVHFVVLADMDSGDTAKLDYYQGAGANNQTDVSSHTYFSGFLVA